MGCAGVGSRDHNQTGMPMTGPNSAGSTGNGAGAEVGQSLQFSLVSLGDALQQLYDR
jgi:hypothetical protein